MSQKLVLFLLVLLSVDGFAQKATWDWAKYGNNTKSALFSKVSEDRNGNVYAAGIYSGTIGFQDSNYTAQGSQGLYLVKYDRHGNFLWSNGINGTGSVAANAICADRNGNLYVGGFFTQSIFLGAAVYTSAGSKDIFLAKFDSNGHFLWANVYGAVGDDIIGGMSTDSKSGVVFNGYFSDTTIHFSSSTLRSGGLVIPQTFMVKHDATGRLIWAKQGLSKGGDRGTDLAIDASDNIYAAGNFYTNVYFDSLKLNNISSGNISASVFLTKYDSGGKVIWATTVGGYKEPGGSSRGGLFPSLVAVDNNGYPIIGSEYGGCCVKFDSSTIMPDPSFTNVVGMWFAKFSPTGNRLWAKITAGTSSDYTYDIACDNAGGIYLAGEYYNDRVFDSDTAHFPPSSQVGFMFVAKYLSGGNLAWLQTEGTSSCGAVPFGISADKPDEVVTVGQFYGGTSLSFGPTTCFNSGTIGNGFVAKMSKSGVAVNQPFIEKYGIYPNPASSELRLYTECANQFDRYAISNSVGQIVIDSALTAQSAQVLSVSHLTNGMYYLVLKGKSASLPIMFMVQH